jgi:hypothetical protein
MTTRICGIIPTDPSLRASSQVLEDSARIEALVKPSDRTPLKREFSAIDWFGVRVRTVVDDSANSSTCFRSAKNFSNHGQFFLMTVTSSSQ